MSDMISRQEVIDLIDYYINHKDEARGKYGDLFVDGMEDGYFRIRSKILNLSSAQPETGYWISARDEDGWHMWLICSECGAKETNLKAKYCPMCGRKMA